jgi:hypothetical protein
MFRKVLLSFLFFHCTSVNVSWKSPIIGAQKPSSSLFAVSYSFIVKIHYSIVNLISHKWVLKLFLIFYNTYNKNVNICTLLKCISTNKIYLYSTFLFLTFISILMGIYLKTYKSTTEHFKGHCEQQNRQ